MVRSPNARPIKVRHLQSFDAAKEFARGLLAEFDWIPATSAAAGNTREADEERRAQIAGIEPLPQTT